MVDEIVTIQETGAKEVSDPGRRNQPPPASRGGTDTKTLVIPISGGKLSSHFGHCDEFAFFDIEEGEIRAKEMRNPPPHEPGALPRWLYEHGADVVIAGGIGDHAQTLLREKGIDVVSGAPADTPESLVEHYLRNTLITGENVCDH
jgi:predicted Fe-Mo cluster-binding NifX family protein